MATLSGSNLFSDIYRLETTDPVKGGAVSGPLDAPTDGFSNAQAQALANRTEFLRRRLLPIGSIVMWTGSVVTPIDNWLFCDGSAVLRSGQYSDLYAVIGDAFGEGDGSTTFNVPDFRGMFPRGVDNMGGSAAGNDPDAASRTASGTGGNTGNNVGSKQGDELKSHSHDVPTVDGIGGSTELLQDTAGSVTAQSTDSTGGNETRPKNIYVGFIIKYR